MTARTSETCAGTPDIWSSLTRAADRFPDRTALVDGDVRRTYAQITGRVRSLSQWLTRRVNVGDRVSIIDHNSCAYFETYYAAAGAGAILNPLNHRLSAAEIAFILRDAGSRWLVTRASFAPLIDQVLTHETPLEGLLWIDGEPELTPGRCDDLASESFEAAAGSRCDAVDRRSCAAEGQVAHLYYTSGTTGAPKGVMLTHRNVCLHAERTVAELGLSERSVWGHIAPMFHLADAWATFAITDVGGRHVMVPGFEPRLAMSAIEQEQITISNLVPTMLNLMVKHPDAGSFDYSSLEVILSGGAPIAPALVEQIMVTFRCDYIQTYGMTESCPYLTLGILDERLAALSPAEQMRYRVKTGRPFSGVALKVVDEGGEPVACDERQVGEIWVKGDTITPGYWNRAEETRLAFHDGWLKTGDLAVIDAEGFVDIVDRKKDMIISGGENIFSIEVEHVLSRHAAVLEAAVFGVPDPIWGESVKAAVVLRGGESATEAELIQFCKANLAAYKAPRSIDFLAELPKTGSGKIFKKALRQR